MLTKQLLGTIYIFCALRIMKDPPIEWFESVFSQGSGISKPPVLRSHDS